MSKNYFGSAANHFVREAGKARDLIHYEAARLIGVALYIVGSAAPDAEY